MSTAKKFELMSVEDYLKCEASSEVRHEFVDGRIFAKVGGTEKHNLITLATATALREHFRGKNCRVFMSDMKVATSGSVYYYPDVMVVCGDQIQPTALYQNEPVLLVEVLSESTEAKDRLEKLVAYQNIPSLREYVLIAQDKVRVDLYRRSSETEWDIEEFICGDIVRLDSSNFAVPIETFYEDVIGSFK